MLVVIVLLLVALLKAAPHMLPYGSESSGPAFAVPHGIVLFIGGMCFIVFLAEGAALDWSAVFLVQERGIDKAYAGLGYAAFALTMTVGRLTGDAIVRRLGATRVIVFGGVAAAAGLLLVDVRPQLGSGAGGLCTAGSRMLEHCPQCCIPAVGKQTVMPQSIAVPAITTLGYAGILAGPAVIGFVAHAASLSFAFGLMALLLLAVAIGGRVLKARQRSHCRNAARQAADNWDQLGLSEPDTGLDEERTRRADVHARVVVAGAGEVLLVEDVFTRPPASGSTPADRNHSRRARSR